MALGRYEVIFIMAPNTPDEELDQLITRFESVITDGDGILLRVERWGRKRLAYEVKKFREGYYVLFLTDCQGDVTKELERRFRMTDRVIKFLTVRVDVELKRAGKLSLDDVGIPRETERIDKGKRSGQRYAPKPVDGEEKSKPAVSEIKKTEPVVDSQTAETSGEADTAVEEKTKTDSPADVDPSKDAEAETENSASAEKAEPESSEDAGSKDAEKDAENTRDA